MRTSAAARGLVFVAALVVVLGTVVARGSSHADEPSAAGAEGMRVYRDPATGAFVPPPPGTTMPDMTGARDSGAARALVETPGTSPAGGVMIDLQGAFQSTVTATVDAQGKVGTHCAETAPAPR